jgi:Cof subfamily protein (haloacid dehalogenase superfamily)
LEVVQVTFKLIALDVDGTILNSRHLIAPETRQAIQAAQARGVRVTLATGRAFPSACMIADKLGLIGTPLVTHDGGYVADRATGAVLRAERMPLAVATAAAGLLQAAGLNVNLLHEQVRVSNQRIPEWDWHWLMPRNFWAAANIGREARVYPHRYARDPAAWLNAHPDMVPPKFYVTGRPDRLRLGRSRLEAELGDHLRAAAAGDVGMEVMPRHVSKAAGVQALSHVLGIAAAEVMCIGDNYNDVEMLQQAGLGVAMGNAPADVQQLAGFVTRSNDEHGVAYAIERFVLREAV